MKLLDLEQGSQTWLEARQQKITATDASIITGVNPWCNPYILWKRKLGLEPPQPITPAMERGMRMEDEARRAFEEYTNIKVKPVVVESADKSWMMASLDGLDASRKHQVEIKCPNPATHAMAKAKQVPKYYEAQIQHQLAVTGLEWSYYFSYDGSEGAIVEVERDQAFIDEMIEKEEDFFRRLREFDPPPQSHLVVKTVEMQRAVDEYCVAQDMKKKATDYEKKAREKLLSISQGNSIQGFGLKLTHYVERGRVDYMAIPELQGVNLDMYRKSPVEKTRLSFV